MPDTRAYWIVRGAACAALVLAACAPRAAPPPSAATSLAKPSARPVATPVPTADPAASTFAVVPLRIAESPIPPVEPTPVGFAAGRPTATPAATPEAAWKYVTITFAIENRSDQMRLLGIAGGDPETTNLENAVLTARDGKQHYTAYASSSSFGLRGAASRSGTSYPVLLRLPPGYRVSAESYGTQSVVAPDPSSLTFKIPSNMTDYGTLTIPPLTSLGPKTDDDTSREIRPLLGGFQPLDMAGLEPGQQAPITFPFASPPTPLQAVGSPVTGPSSLTITLTGVDAADPPDFEARNRGFKLVTLSVRYRNDDQQQTRDFALAAWVFGTDGTVYTGDAPSIGDIGRATTAPDPRAIMLWDGRIAGADQVSAGMQTDPRGLVFQMPRPVQSGVLVFGGDVETAYDVPAIPSPLAPAP